MVSTPRQPPTPGTGKPTTIGRFELHGELDSHGPITTHIARGPDATGANKLVLVEQLSADLAKNRTIASAAAAATRPLVRLRHDNIVPVIEVVEESGSLSVVTEYAEGLSMAELVRVLSERGEQLPLDVALGVLVDLLRGLHAAHEATDDKGRAAAVVHGSVGPEAVIVCVDGVARVRGFALARTVRRHQPRGNTRKPSGTSPEEIAGATVGPRADQFSTSALAWQCMVGRPLFDAADEQSLAEQIADANLEPPSKHNVFVPRACDEVIMRGLERDPSRRWATAGEMAEALAASAVVATPGRMGKWLGRVGGTLLVDRAKRVATLSAAAHGADAATPTGPQAKPPAAAVPKAKPPAAAVPKAKPPAAAAPNAAVAIAPEAQSPAVEAEIAASVPKATPPPAPSARKHPAAVPKAVPPPTAAVPLSAGATTGSADATGEAARGPAVVVEDESPTIGVGPRASEGATNFQAATTQRLVTASAGKARSEPDAPAVKVALHIDETPAQAGGDGAHSGARLDAPAPAAVAVVDPDELPTIEKVMDDRAASPAASEPELDASDHATSPLREAFDELPTIEAVREPQNVPGASVSLGLDAAPPSERRRAGPWLAALGALAAVVVAVVWFTSGGSSSSTDIAGAREADTAATQAAAANATAGSEDRAAQGGSDSSESADSSASVDSSDVDTGAAPTSDATAAPTEPPAVAAAPARTTPRRVAARPPPAAPPPARPATTAAKPKPAATPKSEDDLFSRK